MSGYPATSWLRLAYRLPIQWWRLGFGSILGRVLLLLTHTGRKTGHPRRTVIEYHEIDGRKYAPCVFGPRSDWFQNIVADPRVTIQTASGVESALARRVTTDSELLQVYRLFERRNPVLLHWYLRSMGIAANGSAVVANKDRIYWISFDPTDAVTPPPQAVDRTWVWPLVPATLLIAWLVGQRRRSRQELD